MVRVRRPGHLGQTVITVSAINIFPIKSTRRIEMERCEVTATGLANDRRFMLVDGDGRFLTARRYPRLVLVESACTPGGLSAGAPGMPPLQVAAPAGNADRVEVSVWNSRLTVPVAAPDANRWFSDYLGVACRLAFLPDDVVRSTDQAFSRPGDRVSFADGYPLLLICEESLLELNERLDEPAGMHRFRPNIVVRGARAFAEDTWASIKVGKVRFAGVKACSRCVLTTVDPETGQRHAQKQPLRTLAEFRRKGDTGVYFGQNLIPRGEGEIALGDALEVLESRPARYR